MKDKKRSKFSLLKFLKVGILSIVMTAPFLAVGSSVAYSVCNKNAVSSSRLNMVNKVNTSNTYYFSFSSVLNSSDSSNPFNSDVFCYNFNFISENYNFSFDGYCKFNLRGRYLLVRTLKNLVIYSFEFTSDFSYTVSAFIDPYCFNFLGGNVDYLIYVSSLFDYDFRGLEDTFYRSIDTMRQSSIFNWASKTGVYNAVNMMCSGLMNDSDNLLAFLISYWSINLSIYLILDIVFWCFTHLPFIPHEE